MPDKTPTGNIVTIFKRMLGQIGPDGEARISALIVGDSNSSQPAGYQAILAKDPAFKITTVAQPGKSTSWMLEQAKAKYASGKKFDWLIINGGINDIYTTGINGLPLALSGAKSNIISLVALGIKNKSRVIIIDGTNANLKIPANPAMAKSYGELQKWILAQTKNAKTVSMAKFMKTRLDACEDAACHAKVSVHNQLVAELKKIMKS